MCMCVFFYVVLHFALFFAFFACHRDFLVVLLCCCSRTQRTVESTHTHIRMWLEGRGSVCRRLGPKPAYLLWLLAWAYSNAWLAFVDFEYKQNTHTHIQTKHTHTYTKTHTLTHGQSYVCMHMCISIRINNYEFNATPITHTQEQTAYPITHTHSHSHTVRWLRCCSWRLKNGNKNIKIKFIRLLPASFVNFARCCASFAPNTPDPAPASPRTAVAYARCSLKNWRQNAAPASPQCAAHLSDAKLKNRKQKIF